CEVDNRQLVAGRFSVKAYLEGGMNMILRLATILFFASTTVAAAADCKSITDPTARLACFDAPKTAKRTVTADPFAPAKIAMSRKLTDPESARWGEFWKVTQNDGGPLV